METAHGRSNEHAGHYWVFKMKAAQHCRSPKPCGNSSGSLNPIGFGLRQCCAAFPFRLGFDRQFQSPTFSSAMDAGERIWYENSMLGSWLISSSGVMLIAGTVQA